MDDFGKVLFKKTSDESLSEGLETFLNDLKPAFENGEAVGMMICCSVQLKDGGGYVRQTFGGALTDTALEKLAQSIPVMASFIQKNGRIVSSERSSGQTLH